MIDCNEKYYLPIITGITASDYYTVGDLTLTGSTDDSKLIYVFSGLYNLDGTEQYTIGLNTTLLDPKVTFDGVVGETPDEIDYVLGADPNDIPNTGVHYKTFKNIIINDVRANNAPKSYRKTIFEIKKGGRNEFNTTLSAITKQEEYLGVVFKPEVESDVFIKRGIADIFERHSMLSEIKTTNDIDTNRGGFLST